MKLSFRWFGKTDAIPLNYIRQIPNMHGVVTAVYDAPAGEAWSTAAISDLKNEVETAGLAFEVIESVPVHEDIKLGLPTRDALIENFCLTIRRLGAAGIKVICYNFMPVFDWTRTQLAYPHKDGSNSLALRKQDLVLLNPLDGTLSLPGWDESYQLDELQQLMTCYQKVTEEQLWEHLTYFLNKVIPAAEASGVKLAIHPDDPPYSIFGLPRIITNAAAYQRLFEVHPSLANGVTFCTGSLAASPTNDIYQMLESALQQNRVHFIHVRNIKRHETGDFEEIAHAAKDGSVNMVRIMTLLAKYNYTGYLRPDHGRMIWDETGRPGYGLYDRALGASYLYGLWESVTANSN